MKRISILVLVAVGVLTLMVLAGCDGGGNNGGGNPNAGLGTVSGRLMAGIDDPVGLGGQDILIRTRNVPAVTVARGVTDANGFFTIEGIPPGTYDVIVDVDEATGFVVPPGTVPPIVVVLPDQETVLDDPLTVVDENDVPPDPV